MFKRCIWINVTQVIFLPLGADFNTAVYRVTSSDKIDYFLKLRSGNFCKASVLVPQYLNQIGLQNVILPIATKTVEYWAYLNEFKVILYPYIDGHNAVEAKLSEPQWVQFGEAIKKLHTTNIPKQIKSNLPKETFSSRWCDTVASFLKCVQNEKFNDSIALQTAIFL